MFVLKECTVLLQCFAPLILHFAPQMLVSSAFHLFWLVSEVQILDLRSEASRALVIQYRHVQNYVSSMLHAPYIQEFVCKEFLILAFRKRSQRILLFFLKVRKNRCMESWNLISATNNTEDCNCNASRNAEKLTAFYAFHSSYSYLLIYSPRKLRTSATAMNSKLTYYNYLKLHFLTENNKKIHVT
jgi:hypothetical protein